MIVWIWLLIVLGPIVALNYILVIIIHESGHYLVAKKLGYKLSKFSLSPYGVSLSIQNQNLNYKDELSIAFAGPLANILSSIFVLGVWWLFPSTYFFTQQFVMISMIIALINLFPAYPLDGGRIFISLSSFFLSEKSAKRITIVLNLILSIFFFILFVIFMFINFNPTYLLFTFFLIAGLLDLKFETKYEKINVFNKRCKNFTKPNIYIIDENVTLYELIKKLQISKTILFCIILENGKTIFLSEKIITKLSTKFAINTKIKEILK